MCFASYVLPLKRCSTCSTLKPLDEFHRDPKSTDGVTYTCKACACVRARRHKEANRETINQQAREKRAQWSPEERAADTARHQTYYHQNLARFRARRKAIYWANRDAVLAEAAQAWKNKTPEHHEARKDYLRTFRKRHIEREHAREASYRQQHPARIRAANAKYRKQYPDRVRAISQRHRRARPELYVLKEQRRRARKKHLPDTFTNAERQFMMEYWGFACAVCGNQEGLLWTLALDHWIPLASPQCPGTIAGNIVPLCHGNRGCNNSKHSTVPDVWLVQRFGKQRAAKITQAIATYFAVVHARS